MRLRQDAKHHVQCRHLARLDWHHGIDAVAGNVEACQTRLPAWFATVVTLL